MTRICRGSAKNYWRARNFLFLRKFKKSTVKNQLRHFLIFFMKTLIQSMLVMPKIDLKSALHCNMDMAIQKI
ncbi:uncharacterized protein Dvar_31000 [Desulfosarcina variabilis str. Montpellier]